MKVGVLVLADGESPESLGRVVNAFMVARELKDAGDEVTVVFDGAGARAASPFADSSAAANHQTATPGTTPTRPAIA